MPEQPAAKKSAISLPLAIIIAAALISGAIVLTRPSAPSQVAVASTNSAALRPPSAQDHIVGSPNAPVVIVEYADYQCPFCSMIYPTIKKIVDGSHGQVAWVFRNFPLSSIHPQADPAAQAAECIAGELGNAAFWKFNDAIYTDQSNMTPQHYQDLAVKFGADPTKFAQCVSQKQYDSRITADTAEAVQLGAEGTPYTVVIGRNGQSAAFSGALPYEQVNAVVQSILDKQATSTAQ